MGQGGGGEEIQLNNQIEILNSKENELSASKAQVDVEEEEAGRGTLWNIHTMYVYILFVICSYHMPDYPL